MLFPPLICLLVLVCTTLRELLSRDLRQARSESFPDFLHKDLLSLIFNRTLKAARRGPGQVERVGSPSGADNPQAQALSRSQDMHQARNRSQNRIHTK